MAERPGSVTLATTSPEHAGDAREGSTFDHPGGAATERFQLGAELGRGGMGRVIAATDAALDREVAIKQALSHAPEDLARFAREVRITARLEHPSIVPIYEAGRDAEGRPYYVMRRIAGEPLGVRIARAGDARARLALLPSVLAAVDAAAFAHARGVIHRDIKPANILLGGYGETLLIDWGLARQLDETDAPGVEPADAASEQLTRAGGVYGTISYMAPEQARGEPVDARADVYALGATLFHTLAGTAPFEGISAADRIVHATLGDEPVAFDKLGAEISGELVAIVQKAMAYEPGRRYRDAGELAVDLRAFLAGKLVAAHAYTARERFARWLAKHRLAVAVSTIAAVVLLAGGALAIANVMRARDRAQQAVGELEDAMRIAKLEQASTLVPTDPTRAVAMLRGFPAASPHAARARDIVANAAARGIAHGSRVHTAMIRALEISPDDRTLMSADAAGVIALHDFATSTTRVLPKLPSPVSSAVWLDARTLLVATQDRSLLAIDVATAHPRTLARDVDASSLWPIDGDRVRYFGYEARIVGEISLRTGARRVLAEHVTSAMAEGELLVVDADNLILRDGDRVVTLSPGIATGMWGIAIDPAHERIAVSTMKEVIEYSVATGAELSRTRIPLAANVIYAGRDLYCQTSDGRIVRVTGLRIDLEQRHTTGQWAARTKGGFVVAYDDGSAVVIDATGFHELAFRHSGTHVLAASPRSQMIALGSRDGLVRWWNLASVVPIPLASEHYAICGVDATTVTVLEVDSVVAIDRATGARRTLARDDPTLGIATCLGMASGAAVLASPFGVIVVDARGGVRKLGEVFARIDDATGTVVYARERVLHELAPATGTDTIVWSAPDRITSVAVTDGWAVVQLDNGLLARIRRATREVDTTTLAVTTFGLTQRGAVWYIVGDHLWFWDGVMHVAIARVQDKLRFARGYDDGVVLGFDDRSLWRAGIGAYQMIAAPAQRESMLGPDLIATREGAQVLDTFRVATGERFTRQFSRALGSMTIGSDRRIAVASGNAITVYDDPVPLAPAQLDAWIAGATNAVLDPATDELRWDK